MNHQQKFPTTLIVGGLCFVFLAVPAYGYADPNTVGMVYQILTPLLLAVGACLTFLRRSLASFFGRLRAILRGRAND